MAHAHKVLRSVTADDGLHCVDITERATGYVWQPFRRDPEDPRGWRAMGPVSVPSDTIDAALSDARATLGWVP